MLALMEHILRHHVFYSNTAMVLSSTVFFYYWYICVLRMVKIKAGTFNEVVVANTTISLCHAIIAGFWTTICMVDIIKTGGWMATDESRNLVLSLSTGFFIYDSFVFISEWKRMNLPFAFIVHHVVSTATLVGSVYYGCTGYTVLAQNAEFANIFVHIRKLLHYQGVERTNLFYMVNNIIAAATSIIIRLGGLLFIAVRLNFYESFIPGTLYELAMSGCVIITLFTAVILKAIIKDFTPSRPNQNGNVILEENRNVVKGD